MSEKLRDLAAQMLYSVNVQPDQLWFHASQRQSYSVQFEFNGQNYQLTLEEAKKSAPYDFC